MEKDKMLSYYNANKGAIIGGSIGLFFAVLVISIGLLNTIFISLCVFLGIYIGKRISTDKKYFTNLLDKILPPGTYR